MSDSDTPIVGKEHPFFRPSSPASVEKDRNQGGETAETKTPVLSALFLLCKKLIYTLLPGTRPHNMPAHLKKIFANAAALRKLLVFLANENLSYNPYFNQQLAELWHNLLDDCNNLPLHSSLPPTLLSKVKFFISQVQHFPLGAEHTLGYYFSHDAGTRWIPFPYMNLLNDLHEEFRGGPYRSTLHNWILLLDDILLYLSHV